MILEWTPTTPYNPEMTSKTRYKPIMASKDKKHKYADGVKEEAEESTVSPKKQRMIGRGVIHILSYKE
jgi:hypothetical protein